MMQESIKKWHPGGAPPAPNPNPNPNLVAVLRTIVIITIIVAAALGGLTETLAGLLLSRLP